MSGGYTRPTRLRLVPQPLPDREVRRIKPPRGVLLTLDAIRGEWRASGAVAGCGMFAVVWETPTRTCWAPLHDFMPADQLRLIEACRQADPQAGYSGAWAGL